MSNEKSKLEGMLFDIDGVVIDSEEIYFRSVADTFAQFGVTISREEYVERYMIKQTNSPGIIKEYNLKVSLGEIREIKSRIFEKLLPELRMIPHAQELLDSLSAYPLGAVSSSIRNEVLIKLKRFDLTSKFNIMVAWEDTKHKKPHPEPYQMGARLLQLPAENVVAIEDNPSGVESAKQAGCKVIAYPNGFTKDMQFPGSDLIISDLSEINPSLLRKLYY